MQQKVQFVAAVIHAPDLLILDEPFSGLDPVNADMLNRLIRELHAGGTTIIFSTHVLHHAEQLCDRIFLINKGTKLLDASLDEIHARFDPRSVRARPLHADASIGAIPGAGEIVRTEDGAFDLLLDEGANPQAVMAAALAAAPMRSVELRRLTLEEVFVRLVREDAGAEAAALAREELAHV
jgi:ABC-2 type transport system ATP-binding protein